MNKSNDAPISKDAYSSQTTPGLLIPSDKHSTTVSDSDGLKLVNKQTTASLKDSGDISRTALNFESTSTFDHQEEQESRNVRMMKIVDLPWYEERVVKDQCDETMLDNTPPLEATKCNETQAENTSLLKWVDLPWYQERIQVIDSNEGECKDANDGEISEIPKESTEESFLDDSPTLPEKFKSHQNEEATLEIDETGLKVDETEPMKKETEASFPKEASIGFSQLDEVPSTCSETKGGQNVEAVYDKDETVSTAYAAALVKNMAEVSQSEDVSACFSDYQTATVADASPEQDYEVVFENEEIEQDRGPEGIFRTRTESPSIKDESLCSSNAQPLSVVDISSQQDVEALSCECEIQSSHGIHTSLNEETEVSPTSNSMSTYNVSSQRDIESQQSDCISKKSFGLSKKEIGGNYRIFTLCGLLLGIIVIVPFMALYLTSSNTEIYDASIESLDNPTAIPGPSQNSKTDSSPNFLTSPPTTYPTKDSIVLSQHPTWVSPLHFPTSLPTVYSEENILGPSQTQDRDTPSNIPSSSPNISPATSNSMSATTNTPSTELETTEAPYNQPHSCSICGHGEEVGNINAVFEFVGQPPISCGKLEESGRNGEIPASHCSFLSTLITLCECQPVTSGEIRLNIPAKASDSTSTPTSHVSTTGGPAPSLSPTSDQVNSSRPTMSPHHNADANIIPLALTTTFIPSTFPSTLSPTFGPSIIPSVETLEPSTPSAFPSTLSPTFRPSIIPSVESSEPSTAPSMGSLSPTQSQFPTFVPTLEYSTVPSMESSFPTVKASTAPSMESSKPTHSQFPTFVPTLEHSTTPSMESSIPTDFPTSSPTFASSLSPSMKTSEPTQSHFPTSSVPSSFPTFEPSPAPSSERESYQQSSNFLQFLKESAKEEFYIVNLVKFKEKAIYNDGTDNGLTGKAAYDIYEHFMVKKVFPAVGADMVFNATVSGQRWDNANIVRYPNGTVYLQRILSSFEVQNKMKHKRAAVKECHIFAAKRIRAPEKLRGPIIDNLPFPSSSLDPAFVYMDLLQFRATAQYDKTSAVTNKPNTGREAMDLFDQLSSPRKADYGIRAPAWLNVTVIVKGNEVIDQIRLESVPSVSSYAAMMQLEDSKQIWEHKNAALSRNSVHMSTEPELLKDLYT